MLGTYRDVDVDRAHPMRVMVHAMRRQGIVDVLALDRLDRDATALLLADRLGDAPVSEEFAGLVHGRTRGNPFFVVEILRRDREVGPHGDALSGLHWAARTQGELLETTSYAGGGLPPHVHDDQDEAIYVLSGECELTSGDGRSDLGPGSFAFIPRGTAHGLTVVGDEPCRRLVVFNPPGAMERFYDEARSTEDDPAGSDVVEGVLAIARRLGIGLLTRPV